MEPSNMRDWRQTDFVTDAYISFSLTPDSEITPAEMALAVLTADMEMPWRDGEVISRMIFRRPEVFMQHEECVIYDMWIQHSGQLKTTQLVAYTRHLANLACAARDSIGDGRGLNWTAAKADFRSQSIRFDAAPAAV